MKKKIVLFALAVAYSLSSFAQVNPWQFNTIEEAFGKYIYATKGVFFSAEEYGVIVNSVLIEKKSGKYRKAKVKTVHGYLGDYYEIELPSFLNGESYYVLGETSVNGVTYVRIGQETEKETIIFLIPKDIFNNYILNKHVINPAYVDSEIRRIENTYSYFNVNRSNKVWKSDPKDDWKTELCLSNHPSFGENIAGETLVRIRWNGYEYGTCEEPYKLFVSMEENGENKDYVIKYKKLQLLLSSHSLMTQRDYDSLKHVAYVKDSLDNVRDMGVFVGFYKHSAEYKDSIPFFLYEEQNGVGKYFGFNHGKAVAYSEKEVDFAKYADARFLKERGSVRSSVRMEAAREWDGFYTIRREISKENFRIQKAKEAEARKQTLIKKYGKKQGELIFEGNVRIGMTAEMCREAWGEPDDINRMITQYATHEQWVYGSKSYLYFTNGKLESIQN